MPPLAALTSRDLMIVSLGPSPEHKLCWVSQQFIVRLTPAPELKIVEAHMTIKAIIFSSDMLLKKVLDL